MNAKKAAFIAVALNNGIKDTETITSMARDAKAIPMMTGKVVVADLSHPMVLAELTTLRSQNKRADFRRYDADFRD